MSAIVLYIVFAVWPLVAFLGALAFAPLIGVAALATSPVSVPRFRLRGYMFALLAFFAYAAASVFWSPRPLALATIDFSTGSFAVRSEVLRVGLALLAGGALILVAQKFDDRRRDLLQRVATVAFLVQLCVVVALTLFERQAISLFYGSRPDDEGVQNISRNSQIMVVAAPFLILGLARGRTWGVAAAIAAVIVAIAASVVIVRGVDVGLLTLALVAVCMGLVRLFRQNGFRIIGALVALLIMTAPFLSHFVSRGANAITATNSVEYRQAIWQRVIEIIQEEPVMGSGVGVLRTHREMIPEGVFANLYYIPNHAHNMLLQLWAETGVVGALLLSLAVVLAAFRLPRPDALGLNALRVAAIIGGMMAAWISFDLWNEWWWAVGCLLAVLVAASPRPGLEVARTPRHPVNAAVGDDNPAAAKGT